MSKKCNVTNFKFFRNVLQPLLNISEIYQPYLEDGLTHLAEVEKQDALGVGTRQVPAQGLPNGHQMVARLLPVPRLHDLSVHVAPR